MATLFVVFGLGIEIILTIVVLVVFGLTMCLCVFSGALGKSTILGGGIPGRSRRRRIGFESIPSAHTTVMSWREPEDAHTQENKKSVSFHSSCKKRTALFSPLETKISIARSGLKMQTIGHT